MKTINFKEIEGKHISYKGLLGEISAVLSYGVEILINGSSMLVELKDFSSYLKSGLIVLV